MRRPRAARIVLVLVLITAACCAVQAAEATSDEYTVKAAMVYNFVRFTTWPPSVTEDESRPIRIAVFGDRARTQPFARLDGKEVNGRRIIITQVDKPDDVAGYQLLFLAAGSDENLPAILQTNDGEPLLTVGESSSFLQSGGMINLHFVGKKIRFQVNLDNARAHNLKISSRLLKLASLVISDGIERR